MNLDAELSEELNDALNESLDGLGLPEDLRLGADADAFPDADNGSAEEMNRPSPSELDRPIREVRDLKSIGSILPFGDYDPYPDPNDPCRNLCPRPAGCPPARERGRPLPGGHAAVHGSLRPAAGPAGAVSLGGVEHHL